MNRTYTNYTVETLKNKKFYFLTFISFSHKDKFNKWVCDWKCDCGNDVKARLYDVVYGRKRSCNCFLGRKGKNNPAWNGYEEITGHFWNRVVNGATKRKIKINITIKDAWKQFIKQSRICPLTGEVLILPNGENEYIGTASLDRIDSTKGYEIDNIQWVHKDINQMKWDLTQDYFIKLCKKVVTYLKA